MSPAPFVPDPSTVADDGPLETLALHGRWRLLVDALVRLRAGDGTSHARSLAFLIALIAVQGLISIIGIATVLGHRGIREVVGAIIGSVAPGPVGDAMTGAIDEARRAGAAGRVVAIGVGLAGALVTGTIAMAQLQRSINRLYGIARDRPTLAKYWLAVRLTASAGTLFVLAFAVIALGQPLASHIPDNPLTPAWGAGRYVIGLLLVVGAVALLLRYCPQRPSSGWRWQALGASVAVLIWTVSTAGLNLLYTTIPSFGEIYGPLASMVALLLWAVTTSLGLLYGVALAAELEAVRAARSGQPEPVTNESVGISLGGDPHLLSCQPASRTR